MSKNTIVVVVVATILALNAFAGFYIFSLREEMREREAAAEARLSEETAPQNPIAQEVLGVCEVATTASMADLASAIEGQFSDAISKERIPDLASRSWDSYGGCLCALFDELEVDALVPGGFCTGKAFTACEGASCAGNTFDWQ